MVISVYEVRLLETGEIVGQFSVKHNGTARDRRSKCGTMKDIRNMFFIPTANLTVTRIEDKEYTPVS